MKAIISCAAAFLTLATVTTADAKGCLKGAVVGGTAGHFAGHHGILGAAAGCVIGRHSGLGRRQTAALPHGVLGRSRNKVAQADSLR
jgi:hypothetical protein